MFTVPKNHPQRRLALNKPKKSPRTKPLVTITRSFLVKPEYRSAATASDLSDNPESNVESLDLLISEARNEMWKTVENGMSYKKLREVAKRLVIVPQGVNLLVVVETDFET